MEGRGRNSFYGCGNGLTKNPNAQTFPLDSPSWYTPTQFAPQNFKNHQGTFFPSSAFGEFSLSSGGIDSTFQEDGVPAIPPLAMDQSLGVDCMFQDGGHCTPLEQVKGYPNINFTNRVINPPNDIPDNGPITPRNYTKRLWTSEEDSKLCELVDQFGTKNWAVISDYMDVRAGKQCRERWYNNLRPDIKADDWSEEEERILVQAHERMGNKWSKIVKLLPGRTENAIKNHWNAAIRKKTMRIKSKKDEPHNRKPKSTILRDYIRGIASTSTNNTAKTGCTNNVSLSRSTASSVTKGNFTAIPPDEPPSSYCSYSPAIDLVPSFDDESTFFQNLFPNVTIARQHEFTTSMEPLILAQEPQNPQEFNGHSEYGSASSSVPNGSYLPCPLGEPITFSNSSNPVYGYGDMNMDLDLGHVWKN